MSAPRVSPGGQTLDEVFPVYLVWRMGINVWWTRDPYDYASEYEGYDPTTDGDDPDDFYIAHTVLALRGKREFDEEDRRMGARYYLTEEEANV